MIVIDTIAYEDQRYPTLGDWQFFKDGSLYITVAKCPDKRSEICIAVHELVEALLCQQDGVTQESVDAFDKDFEMRRAAGLVPDRAEPGADEKCPCAKQHAVADIVERLVATNIGLSWNQHTETCDKVEDLGIATMKLKKYFFKDQAWQSSQGS